MLAVAAWPEGAALDPENGRGLCIESTKFMISALRRLQVDAKAMAVDVWAGNADAVAHRPEPMDTWPPTAFSIGSVCATGAGGPEIRAEPHRRGSFMGHLVIVGDDWLVDLTAEQFSRPQFGVHVNGGVCAYPIPGVGAKDPFEVQMSLPAGGQLIYQTRPEVKSWRTVPAWRDETGEKAVADEVVRRVLEAEGRGQPGVLPAGFDVAAAFSEAAS
jgi:hypothetical protein